VVEFTATTPDSLAASVARRADRLPGRVVVAVDGPDAGDPMALARLIVERVQAGSRTCAAVSLHDFVRPASLRFEHGRDDEASYRFGWFDYAAVQREVLTPFREQGRWLPALWNEHTDRSARARPLPAAADTVLVVAGAMLLGRGLDFDVAVALRMSEAAQRRRIGSDQWFTVAAVAAHQRESTQCPDYDVVWDHPDRPAIRR
jgi:hypothetical protein